MSFPIVPPGEWLSIPGTRLATGNANDTQPLFHQSGQYVTSLLGGNNSPERTWAWCGLTYDSLRGKVLSVCNGGHDDSADNGVYEWDIQTTQSWSQALQTSYSSPGVIIPVRGAGLPTNYNDATGAYGPAGPRPCSRHSYWGCVFMPDVGPNGKVWLAGGSRWDVNGSQTQESWHYDPIAKTFVLQSAAWVELGIQAQWDPARSVVIVQDSIALWQWDPHNGAGVKTQIGAFPRQGAGGSCLWDAQRRRFVVLSSQTGPGGNGNGLTIYTLTDANPSVASRTLQAVTGSFPTFFANIDSLGFLRDPIRDKYIIWSGAPGQTKQLYSIDPDTFVGTILNLGGAVSPSIGAITGNAGTYSRFFYYPTEDVYLLFNGPTEQAFAVRHPDSTFLSAPHLSFTDVGQVNRSGNSDISHGQVLNQDGGFVTVWGNNLGTNQGTSTITLGGVPQTRIYYWGTAVSPWSPANLHNEYQDLHCIIFQVDHTTPTGAQNIVATVAGVASNGLSINVSVLGTIRYAGAGGTFSPRYASIQLGLNAMQANDTLYVLNNTFTPGGCTVPASTNAANNPTSQPFMVVGYPGALSQVGDSSHEAFAGDVGINGVGRGTVFAKLNIIGNQQPITLHERGRVVGCTLQCPVGSSLNGTLWCQGSNIFILGNEFTNCGHPSSFEIGYHVVYSSGYRDIAGTPALERFREIAWNYFHDNSAARAINCFNTSSVAGASNPLTDHVIHDNVIINQELPGILLSTGTCGKNWIYNNILFNTGLANLDDGGAASCALELRSEYPRTTPPIARDANEIYIFNNTIWRSGASIANSKCAFFFRSFEANTYHINNNIVDQDNGFPYVTFQTGSGEVFPTFVSSIKNNWFGAGAAPFFDTSPIAGDPLFVNEGSPKDLHLQQTSPDLDSGVNLASGGLGLYDLDGTARTAWNIGAYEGIGQAPSLPPASISMTWDGKIRDRVRPGGLGLTPDGLMDGTMTLTFTSVSGRTVTKLELLELLNLPYNGFWDTFADGTGWALGVALGLDTALLNDPVTAAVNFAPADGSTVKLFGSADLAGLFTVGDTLTVSATFNDLSIAQATATVVAGNPPPNPQGPFTVTVSGNVLADIIGSLILTR